MQVPRGSLLHQPSTSGRQLALLRSPTPRCLPVAQRLLLANVADGPTEKASLDLDWGF